MSLCSAYIFMCVYICEADHLLVGGGQPTYEIGMMNHLTKADPNKNKRHVDVLMIMFALDFLLHYPMHVGAVNVCLGFPRPLSNARGGC